MNRAEFMSQLGRLLYDLPENERQDALDYYNDYFDDAGPENEGIIIQELGSPGKVAAGIRANYRGDYSDQGQYTDRGYQDHETEQENPISPVQPETEQKNGKRRRNNQGHDQEYRYEQKDRKGRRGIGGWFLIILLAIIFFPVILGIAGGVFGILAAFCASVLALFLSGFILAGIGVALVVKGVLIAITSLGSGFLLVGVGLILLAVGLLLIVFFIWILFKILPKAFRGLIDWISRIIHHGRGRENEGGADQ